MKKTFALCMVSLGLAQLACAANDKPADQPQAFNAQPGYNAYPPPQGYPQQGYPPQQQQAYAPPPAQGVPQPQPQAPPPPGAPPAQPTASSTGAPPASPIPGIPLDPSILGQISSAGLAVLTPGGVAGDPIEAGIKAAALRFAPNMQPEGQMAKDTLQEGGHKEMVVQLAAGKCYTVVGFSPLGQIKNLDLRLLAPPFYNIQAGQDDTADNTPVIGKSQNPTCPISPFPLQYKIDISAKQGSGQFGVQVFSRSK